MRSTLLFTTPVKVTRPAVPMEDRHNLGFKELIEQARTPYAGSVQAKQENISLAAKRLNGVVVPPGGTFSFNKELGSTSLDAGFKVGQFADKKFVTRFSIFKFFQHLAAAAAANIFELDFDALDFAT